MPSSPEGRGEIVELEATRGNRFDENGETVASLDRHLIFLPRGAQPDCKVRVALWEMTGKTDRNGRALYRSVPAPPVEGERWKEENNQAVRMKISTDWKGEVTELEESEARPFATREMPAGSRTDRTVVWGADLASSTVMEEEVKTIQSQTETAENGALGWKVTGSREEHGTPVARTISKAEVKSSGSWYQNRYAVTYDPTWELELAVNFQPGNNGTNTMYPKVVWPEVPVWYQQEMERSYPLCNCSRERHDAVQADGYDKCRQCRQGEQCVRCGKQPVEVKNLNGRLVCSACEAYEAQEQIAQRVTADERQRIADLAGKLLAGRAMPRELGELVLPAGLDHIISSSRREAIAKVESGYAWYYLTDEGMYGSKFPPEALEFLRLLPQATGNGFVRLIAWLTGSQKESDCERNGDFYYRSQVKGENIAPSLTESAVQTLTLAVWLRGSELERLAFIEALAELLRLAETDEFYSSALKSVEQIEGDEAQDYARMREKVEEVTVAAQRKIAERETSEQLGNKKLQPILEVARQVLGYRPEVSHYSQIMGENSGMILDSWGRLSDVNDDGPKVMYDRREATIVASRQVAGGTLEFLTYYKYGRWNLVMRWRELTEADAAQAEEAEEVPETSSALDGQGNVNLAAAAELLRAKFKGLS